MPRGRPAKPIEELKKAGSYRKDRHAARERGDSTPATNRLPPESVPVELHERWAAAVADLEAVGIVTATDLFMLERAFVQLGNSMALQLAFEGSLHNSEATPSDISKFQSATSSATSSFLRLMLEVRRAVKINPRQAESDPLGEWLDK